MKGHRFNWVFVTIILMLLQLRLNGQDWMNIEENRGMKWNTISEIKGKFISQTKYILGSHAISPNDSNIISIQTAKYDSHGNLTEMIEHDSTGNRISVMKKDTVKKITEFDMYNVSGKLDFIMRYKFNAQWKLIELDDIKDSLILSKSTPSYDENGYETGRKVYGLGDALVSSQTNVYNDKHQLIAMESTYITRPGSAPQISGTAKQGPAKTSAGTLKTEYKYDTKGNTIEETNLRDGKLSNKIYYKYDKDGNEILRVYINPVGGSEIIKTEYVYDNAGNWIALLRNSKELVTRKIEIQ